MEKQTRRLTPFTGDSATRITIVVSLEEYERVNRAPEGLALCVIDTEGTAWELYRTFDYAAGCLDTECLAKR